MRFQPSWVWQELQGEVADSLFIPAAPRANSLLWFKRIGISCLVHDPTPGGAIALRALLENPGEPFAEELKHQINRTIRQSVEMDLNPFRTWLDRPFSRRQLDHLFFWREAGFEIEAPLQRELFGLAIQDVLHFWLNKREPEADLGVSPDEILGYYLNRLNDKIFPGREPVKVLSRLPSGGEAPVEAGVGLVCFRSEEIPEREFSADEYFHAWLSGDGDLTKARKDLEIAWRDWTINWKKPLMVEPLLPVLRGCKQVVFTWSGEDHPPRVYEEQVIKPIQFVFQPWFSKSEWRYKGANRLEEQYDFLLILRR